MAFQLTCDKLVIRTQVDWEYEKVIDGLAGGCNP